MILNGWEEKYKEILREFKFERSRDTQSANILNSILKNKVSLRKLERRIKNKIVFIIGAGPSLSSALPYLKNFKGVTKIVADGATKALIENGIRSDVIVTDLDGNIESLKKASDSNSIMVVHAHGDNIRKLPNVVFFKNCLGTTQSKPFGKIRNFGGFTDGDRCVFLANYFGARKIILVAMDFGTKIGKYSKDGKYNRIIKLKKLKRGKLLLEWLAPQSTSNLYTTTQPIRGFKEIKKSKLRQLIGQKD
jgi:uncharacterized Rossmann fold enzyme